MRFSVLLMLFTLIEFAGFAQQNILDSPDTQNSVEKCLYATYGNNFNEARSFQKSLEIAMPAHPAPYFLKALIIYWENFPMLLDDPDLPDFIGYMDKAVELSGEMLDKDPKSLEGIFFDMHARAFKAMYWADNGKPGKVIRDLDNMYRQSQRGIELKDQFNEFYFSSGIYNYYIEAYVELHPAYKPIAALFRRGNKEVGIQEIEYAIKTTTYIKYEAILFLSLLQLNYENDIEAAIDPASILYNNFPKNIYFTSQYLILLLYSSNYTVASIIADKIDPAEGIFQEIIVDMVQGFILENKSGKNSAAKNKYQSAIANAEIIGPIGDLYAAISYAGLSKIAEKEGNSRATRVYKKKSSQLSGYQFILEF